MRRPIGQVKRRHPASTTSAFHYGKQGGVIEQLDLHIRPGEKVGLVGRSGAGKSTIVNLLLRFYDREGGRDPDRRHTISPIVHAGFAARAISAW